MTGMTIADKIATHLTKGLFFGSVASKDPRFVGARIQRSNRIGEPDLEIDKEIYGGIEKVAQDICEKYGVALKIVSESAIKKVGKGDLYKISLDECDGSVNKNPEFRATMAGVGLDKGRKFTTKEITAGAIMRFDGKIFFTKSGKAFINDKEGELGAIIRVSEDVISDYPQIAICSHHENHWSLYSKFIKNFGENHEFNPKIYGSTSGEVTSLMLGYLDAVIDLRELFEKCPRPAKVWDVSASKPILEGAGFIVTNGYGKELDYDIEGKGPISLIAATPKLHNIILETVKKTFDL